jgi:hypothetical protein
MNSSHLTVHSLVLCKNLMTHFCYQVVVPTNSVWLLLPLMWAQQIQPMLIFFSAHGDVHMIVWYFFMFSFPLSSMENIVMNKIKIGMLMEMQVCIHVYSMYLNMQWWQSQYSNS